MGITLFLLRYNLYRDGQIVSAHTPSRQGSYLDTNIIAGRTYEYEISSVDGNGKEGPRSDPVVITVPPLSSSFSVPAEADAYVDSETADTAYGELGQLQVDGSPDVRSYLRFTVRGIEPEDEIKSAVLRLIPYSDGEFTAHDVEDDTWSETTINYNNAPPLGAELGTSSDAAVDVTSLVTGNGTFSFALTTTSPTLAKFFSREVDLARAPKLDIETGPIPPTGTLLTEDFETAALPDLWKNFGMTVTQDVVDSGGWASRATSEDGVQAYTEAPLLGTVPEATYTVRFNLLAQGDNNVNLLYARVCGDTITCLTQWPSVIVNDKVTVFVTSTGRLATRTGAEGSRTSDAVVTPGWHTLKLHVVIGGEAGGLTELWLDDVLVQTRTNDLGDIPLGIVTIGERNWNRNFDVAFDNLEVTAP